MTTRRVLLASASAAIGGLALPSAAHAVGPNGLYSSGALGDWRKMGHAASPTAIDEAVAAHPQGVRLVGDSIAQLTTASLRTTLARLGRPLSWDTWSGRPTGALLAPLTRAAAGERLPQTVVVVSGSNDIFAPTQFPRHLEGVLNVFGAARDVVWVSPHVSRRASPASDVRNSALICLALERAATRHTNLTVVPWFDVLAAKPAYRIPAYTPDGVHPTSAAGTAAFVALITRAL